MCPERRKICDAAFAGLGKSGGDEKSRELHWLNGSKSELLLGGAFGAAGEVEGCCGIVGLH